MDKTITKLVISLLLVSVFLTALCTEKKEVPATTIEMSTSTLIQVTEPTDATGTTSDQGTIPLSDLQKDACNAADSGKTCNTKLADLGIVAPQDCCRYMKKCCT